MYNNISEICLGAVDKLAYAADKTLTHGKQLLETAALQKRLATAQRQLGALVYSLSKRGEENTLLVSRYIETIALIEQKLEQDKVKCKPSKDTHDFIVCSICGCKCKKTATFCQSCGEHI